MHPPRENSHCRRAARRAVALAESDACARRCRVSIAIRFASASIIRCRSANLVEYRLISVYRQSPQCGERSNAAFGRQSAAVLPSHAPHDSKARLQNEPTRKRFMAKPCTLHPIAQRVQPFKLQTRNVRGQGAEPLAFSWGSKGAILSRERMAPLFRAAPSALPLPPAPCAGNSLTRWANQKSATFLKNPLDKWAPRAIMQPTSEELQTYDGEK